MYACNIYTVSIYTSLTCLEFLFSPVYFRYAEDSKICQFLNTRTKKHLFTSQKMYLNFSWSKVQLAKLKRNTGWFYNVGFIRRSQMTEVTGWWYQFVLSFAKVTSCTLERSRKGILPSLSYRHVSVVVVSIFSSHSRQENKLYFSLM